MSTAKKLFESMQKNPLDWRMEQLLTVARQYGFEVRSNGGSHHVFSHSALVETLSIPARKPIKPLYIKRLCALIEQIKEQSP